MPTEEQWMNKRGVGRPKKPYSRKVISVKSFDYRRLVTLSKRADMSLTDFVSILIKSFEKDMEG